MIAPNNDGRPPTDDSNKISLNLHTHLNAALWLSAYLLQSADHVVRRPSSKKERENVRSTIVTVK